MGKPRLIILIRHAQSEGNKNREIHQTTPDHRVKLTTEGHRQAAEAGRKLRSLLRPDDTLHFFTSPYRRTRETTEGILRSLTSDTPTPSPFPRHTIKVYEEPRLREQDFGNFQPSSAEMTRMWHERANYGHFFYRIPNGESAADAYDRVSGFNESLWRSFGDDDFASVCVLVTHGLMARVFLMKWYHWSVEYFEDLRNVNHCEFVVMAQSGGKYVLKNQLRTWSDYRREIAAEQREQRAEEARLLALQPTSAPIPERKWWTGCAQEADPGGHRAMLRPPRRQNTADLFQDDGVDGSALQRKSTKSSSSSDSRAEHKSRAAPSLPSVAVHRAPPKRPQLLSPATISMMHGGRDGGGSRSGNASRSGSSSSEEGAQGQETRIEALRGELESSLGEEEKERLRRFRPPRSMAVALSEGEGMADALGDQSEMEEEDENVREKIGEEGSFAESVR